MTKTKPPLEDILKIDDEVLQALGITRDEMAGMGMRTLIELAMDKGYDITVDSQPSKNEGEGRASVRMATEGPALEGSASITELNY